MVANEMQLHLAKKIRGRAMIVSKSEYRLGKGIARSVGRKLEEGNNFFGCNYDCISIAF
jgi:hypothetical protein